jgi:hypothetical protein
MELRPQSPTKEEKTAPKAPEKLDIPKYLMKSTSTYYKKATDDEIKEEKLRTSTSNHTKSKKKSVTNSRHTKLNSFDYSKLTRNSEWTDKTDRDLGLFSIPSARLKDEFLTTNKTMASPRGEIVDAPILSNDKSIIHSPHMKTSNPHISPPHTGIDGLSSNNLSFNVQSNNNLNDTEILDHNGMMLQDLDIIKIQKEGADNNILTENQQNTENDFVSAEGVRKPFVHRYKRSKQLDNKENVLQNPPVNYIIRDNMKVNQTFEDIINRNKHRRVQSCADIGSNQPIQLKDIEITNSNNAHMSYMTEINEDQGKENSEKLSERSGNACLVCFDKTPDAVFMECGHGGICYDCSLEVWKATNECFLCRNKITQVLQIDMKNPKSAVIKVISSTQMVAYEEEVVVEG